MILKYIWSEKPHKISYDKLVQDYYNYGLRLVNLQTKDLALKAAWPVRFKDRTDISWLYTTLPIKDERIWYCNTKPSDIDPLFPEHTLSVVKFIWKAWVSHHYRAVPDSPDDILNTYLWGNSLI